MWYILSYYRLFNNVSCSITKPLPNFDNFVVLDDCFIFNVIETYRSTRLIEHVDWLQVVQYSNGCTCGPGAHPAGGMDVVSVVCCQVEVSEAG